MAFLLNLGLSSSAVLYELANNKRTSTPAYVSTITALLIFIGIIFYHAQRRLFLTKVGAMFKDEVHHKWAKIVCKRGESLVNELQTSPLELSHQVTFSTVGLTSPLLDDTEERAL